MLFRNEQGRWVIDAANTRLLANIGMVSGAVWSDLDGDGTPELILACEWGPIRIFRNNAGKLLPWDPPVTLDARRSTLHAPPSTLNAPRSTLHDFTGLWSGITTGDIDGDGLPDLLVSY